MSLLSEIKAAVTGCGLPVETGVFSGEPPEEYVVVTPLADTYELHVILFFSMFTLTITIGYDIILLTNGYAYG